MKSVVALLLLAAAASAFTESEYQTIFTDWMVENQKSYAPEEFFYRYDVFKANLDWITAHNLLNNTYTVGLGPFTDLTLAEYKLTYLGYRMELRREPIVTLDQVHAYPSGSLDWTTKGAVTGVKNQGQCGSCWAFSTTGSVEGTVALLKGHLTSLSEQQLVDCAGAYGNAGCNGGLMDNAFKYVMKNGLCTESAYPYTARDGTCKSSSCTMSADSKISTYKDVTHTENSLGAAVDITPVSVAIEADQAAFQNYKSGVLSGICGKQLDHGVLVVGYGTDVTTPYWKVKNSWGTSWGEAGYVRIIRNQDECGIADEPSYPVA
jgi:cathepsin L